MKITKAITLYFLSFTFAFFFALSSCQQGPVPVTIAISKGAPIEYYGNYHEWLKAADSTIICVDLYHMPIDSALLLLDDCSGLLLTGGPDVYPGRYGQDADTVKCGDIDYFRDSLEWSLISKAKEMEIPILGICRGLQIFNIYHEGSLYPDLPTTFDSTVAHRCPGTYDCPNPIRVKQESGLYQIAGQQQGIVNSNHHQGIRRLGTGLAAIARSEDGLIESIEYKGRNSKAFFLGVQWHPERMEHTNPFSLNIAKAFLEAANNYKVEK